MRKQRKLPWLLLAANLALIWGNSMLPADESGELSGSITAFLQNLLQIPASAMKMAEHLVRKTAHFTEFCSLGLILTWLLRFRHRKSHTAPALCGLLAACVDETIQIFSPGRTSRLVDVWIDMAGVTAGMMLMNIGYHWYQKKQNTK